MQLDALPPGRQLVGDLATFVDAVVVRDYMYGFGIGIGPDQRTVNRGLGTTAASPDGAQSPTHRAGRYQREIVLSSERCRASAISR